MVTRMRMARPTPAFQQNPFAPHLRTGLRGYTPSGGCRTVPGARTMSRSSSEATILPEKEPETEARRVVSHLCPTCNQKFWTAEEVRTHWLESHAKPTPNASNAPVEAGQGHKSEVHSSVPKQVDLESAAPTPETMKAKIVEVDEHGQPVVVRQQEGAHGGIRTIVTLEDGACRAFGEAIVASLLAQEEQKVDSWISSMKDRSLRGLVNELSERFFEMQKLLAESKKQLEEKRRSRGLTLFNLQKDCTEKDLDAAYRRLARSMHPDKNGGTEEAKEQFQLMRASYEELKEQLGQCQSPVRQEASEPQEEPKPREEQEEPQQEEPEEPPAEEPPAEEPPQSDDTEAAEASSTKPSQQDAEATRDVEPGPPGNEACPGSVGLASA
ncbi:unnamed protein product [Effrenium voratum]|nr:unnamed protein product [Effrenium voratum]